MGVSIEKMTLRHYEAAAKLWEQCEGIRLGKSDEREAIARYLRRNNGLSLVAMADGRLVGTVLCGHDGQRGILHHLAVATDCRRRGIGQTLVKAALGKLKQARVERCRILVLSQNRVGRKFWKALGWEEYDDVVCAGRKV